MAPKRSAPQPPADSSEETASGSGSDESEEIPYSPPSAALKNTAPPPQKVKQPEASDEEEEDEEEEDEEEEEEEDKVKQATSPSTTKNPPPANLEEPESESEEETDDEAPESKPTPKQEAEGKGGKRPASSEDKKPSSEHKKPAGRILRVWSKDDDVRIIEALAAHRRKHGTLPQPDELEATLAGSLDNSDYGRKDLLGKKVKSLKSAYTRQLNKGGQPSKDIDRRIYNLSKEVWGRGDRPENGTAPRDFGQMCELYPHLAEEMRGVEKTHPGLFKREFGMISDEKASALETKIKKQRLMQSKVELHRYDYFKEVIKTLMDLVE